MRPFAVLVFVITGMGLLVLHACQDTSEITQQSSTFAVATRKLTVSGAGKGSGVVTSKPIGINCSITRGVAALTGCTKFFQRGVLVTLTAKPRLGHAFQGWVNFPNCSGTGTCVLNMSGDRAVSARFAKGPFTIRISSGSPGDGRIMSQAGLIPAIDCVITNGIPSATGCSATYPANQRLTLTAVPGEGFVFGGWPIPSCGTGICDFAVIQHLTIPAAFSPPSPSNPSVRGEWGAPFSTPIIAVHMHLLPTGKVLLWGSRGQTELWDPSDGFTPAAQKPYRIFCSGHTFLPDGRLLVIGGTNAGTLGLRYATAFDPSSEVWSATSLMAQGRYYPTATTLPSGEILALSGHDTAKVVVTIPEVLTGSGWRRLTTAPLAIPDPYYPPVFVAPNGKVFLAGFHQTTRYLDVTGTGVWTTVGNRIVADRALGSAVMYAPGRILYAGGGKFPPLQSLPTASAEIIDLNEPAPVWRSVASMAFARRQMNATILADGSVLVTGGTSGPGFNDQAGAVRFAELWNPTTESWTTMAPEMKNRTYHSVALLLPSGQVLSSGGGEGGGVPYDNSEFSAQLFSPPYLFQADGSPAARPSITSAPAQLSYGQTFVVETPDAAEVTRGTLIRLSSVTHTVNMSQLAYPLTFESAAATSLTAMAPTNGNLAPPGPYMLFLINRAGAPSVASMVSVGP